MVSRLEKPGKKSYYSRPRFEFRTARIITDTNPEGSFDDQWMVLTMKDN